MDLTRKIFIIVIVSVCLLAVIITPIRISQIRKKQEEGNPNGEEEGTDSSNMGDSLIGSSRNNSSSRGNSNGEEEGTDSSNMGDSLIGSSRSNSSSRGQADNSSIVSSGSNSSSRGQADNSSIVPSGSSSSSRGQTVIGSTVPSSSGQTVSSSNNVTTGALLERNTNSDRKKVISSSLYPNTKGPIGLTNNSKRICFLNAAVQSLFHLPKFRKWIHSQNGNTYLLKAIKQTFKELGENSTPPEVCEIRKALGIELKEEDSGEMLYLILHKLKNEMVNPIFEPGAASKYIFGEADASSIVLDFIELSAKKPASLEDRVRNGYLEGHTPSPILMIKYGFEDLSRYNEKPPSTLNLYKGSNKEDCKYILTQVIIHSGEEITTGHYYIYINDPEKNEWTLFNDSSVTKRPEKGQAIYKDSERPCLLVYVRETDLDDVYSNIQG